jgi:hypothetical protein
LEGANVAAIAAKLRAAGMDLWVEDGRVRGRMGDGGKIPYATRQLAEQFRDLGMIAVDFLQHEALIGKPVDSPVEPDGTGEIHELVGMNAVETFSLGEFIKEGRGELIGNVLYHKPTGLFDAKVRFLKGWAD